MKYGDFQKCIPVSWDKNINFEEVRWNQKYILVSRYENINFDELVVFPEMYTWFKLYKYQFWWSMVISRNVFLFHGIKILILKKFVDINKYIPISRYENINFDEVVVFPEMYTWFDLYKYLFSSSTLISRIVYLFHGIKILILKKYVDFQKCIPVSGYKNIDFDEVVVFPEMYT